MSKRWQSRRPYESPPTEVYYAAEYGELQSADPRDLTILPVATEPDPWLDGLIASVEAVGGGLLVILCWQAGRLVLGLP